MTTRKTNKAAPIVSVSPVTDSAPPADDVVGKGADKATKLLLDALGQWALGGVLAGQARDERKGAYSEAVDAAIACGTLAVWTPVAAGIDNRQINNVDGLAVKLELSLSAKAPAGLKIYKVHSSWSAAKSYLTTALENNVPLTEKAKKGGKMVARSYGKIRKDVDKVKADKAVKALTGDDAIRHAIRARCSSLEVQTTTVHASRLPAMLEAVEALLEQVRAFERISPPAAQAETATLKDVTKAETATPEDVTQAETGTLKDVIKVWTAIHEANLTNAA